LTFTNSFAKIALTFAKNRESFFVPALDCPDQNRGAMLKAILRASAMVTISLAALLASPTISNRSEELEAYDTQASVFVGQKNQPTQIVAQIKAKNDDRAERLAKFLESQGSPMTADAASLVEIADKYDLDWKILPAIAGVESTFGAAIPSGSYNPYGWNNGNFRFKDWETASDYVAKEIKTRWGTNGEITPWKMGPGYAASPTWASRVSSYMRLIAAYR